MREFHCIMPLANVPSVLKLGILSHERAAKVDHQSAAMQEIQDRRDRKNVPGGLRLHQYANLYFHARNPMLFKRRDHARRLCVLRVSRGVINLEGVVITDCNAASNWVRFLHPAQHAVLDFDSIYAIDWRHPNDEVAFHRHKLQKCAEVLVPHCVDPQFLTGIYVVDQSVAAHLGQICDLQIMPNPEMFFH